MNTQLQHMPSTNAQCATPSHSRGWTLLGFLPGLYTSKKGLSFILARFGMLSALLCSLFFAQQRVWGQTYSVNLPTSGAATAIPAGQSCLVYDNGGPTANYSNGVSGYVYVTALPGYTITIQGSYYTESSFDYLKIYSGNGVAGTLRQSYSYWDDWFVYTGTSGEGLTIQLTSDGSTTETGIKLLITYSNTSTLNTPSTGNNSVACGTNTRVFDNSGGADATYYSSNSSGYTVLNAAATASIRLLGVFYTESCCDNLKLYSGTGTGGSLLATYKGSTATNTAGQVIDYTVAAGTTVTIAFSSDGSVNYEGFALSVIYSGSCITCTGSETTYYSKSSGNLDVLTNWGSNTDGTGCSPSNFTTAGITYIIQNNSSPTTSTSGWSVSGAGSIVKVGDGSSAITFTAGANLSFDCDLEITGNATLNLNDKNMTLSGDLIRSASTSGFNAGGTAGTVTFSGSSQNVNVTANNGTTPTDSDITFNHVTISGSNVKLFYFKTNDRKLNINNFTVNNGAVVTLYSNPQ